MNVIDATRKLPGEGLKRPWPPLIKMEVAVRQEEVVVEVEKLL